MRHVDSTVILCFLRRQCILSCTTRFDLSQHWSSAVENIARYPVEGPDSEHATFLYRLQKALDSYSMHTSQLVALLKLDTDQEFVFNRLYMPERMYHVRGLKIHPQGFFRHKEKETVRRLLMKFIAIAEGGVSGSPLARGPAGGGPGTVHGCLMKLDSELRRSLTPLVDEVSTRPQLRRKMRNPPPSTRRN